MTVFVGRKELFSCFEAYEIAQNSIFSCVFVYYCHWKDEKTLASSFVESYDHLLCPSEGNKSYRSLFNLTFPVKSVYYQI